MDFDDYLVIFCFLQIFTESKDEFAVVLFGTEETDNPLALDSGGYSNICVARELQTPTWDLVKYVRNELAPQNPVQADCKRFYFLTNV